MIKAAGILQTVMEVAPNEEGHGSAMTLLWDGDEKAMANGEMFGQIVSTELTPERLLEDVKDLTQQACDGQLQIVKRNEDIIQALEEFVNG